MPFMIDRGNLNWCFSECFIFYLLAFLMIQHLTVQIIILKYNRKSFPILWRMITHRIVSCKRVFSLQRDNQVMNLHKCKVLRHRKMVLKVLTRKDLKLIYMYFWDYNLRVEESWEIWAKLFNANNLYRCHLIAVNWC